MEQTMQRHVRVIPAVKREKKAVVGKKQGRKRVAAYCRVSTDTEEQLNSYTAQKAYYTQLIEENPDWEMAGVFADEGLSGTGTKKREQFNRMIAACKRGRIEILPRKLIQFQSVFMQKNMEIRAFQRFRYVESPHFRFVGSNSLP